MEVQIERLVRDYETGHLNRRQLLRHLGAVTAMAAAAPAAGSAARAAVQAGSTFSAVGLNHIALSVTDIPRSRDFYVQHLGLTVSRESANNCFLDCGDNFVALFRSSRAGLNHYCYEVEDYDVEAAADTLRANDLPPRIAGQRIYFDDPDGLEVQLAAPGHSA